MITLKYSEGKSCFVLGVNSQSTFKLPDKRKIRYCFRIEFYPESSIKTRTIETPTIFEDDDLALNILLGHRAGRVKWRDRNYNSVFHAKMEGDIYTFSSTTAIQEEGHQLYDPSVWRVYPGADDGCAVYLPGGSSDKQIWKTSNGKWAATIWRSGVSVLFGVPHIYFLWMGLEPGTTPMGMGGSRYSLPTTTRTGNVKIRSPYRWKLNGSSYTQYNVPTMLSKAVRESEYWGRRYNGNTYEEMQSWISWAETLLSIEESADGSDWEILQWSNLQQYMTATTSLSDHGIDNIEKSLTSFPLSSFLDALMAPRADWAALATEAYQNIGLWGSNGLAYMKDLPGTPQLCYDLSKKINSACQGLHQKKAGIVAKAIAATYLGVHYGLKLTMLDTADLLKKLNSSSNEWRLARVSSQSHSTSKSGVKCDFRYTAVYDQFAALEDEIAAFSMITDTNIDLENIWDLVPWSFVVDWFVKVGDSLAALDNYHNITAVYESVAAIQSAKSRMDIPPEMLKGLLGATLAERSHVELTLYRRSCSKVPIMPNPYPSVTTVNPLTHWVEGLALHVSIN